MTSATTLPVIEYARGCVPLRRRHRWIMPVASLPSVIVPFAPFVWDVSPLTAARYLFADNGFDGLAISLLGAGFFAALPAIAWRALLLRRIPPRGATRTVFLLLATPLWVATVWVNVLWCRGAIDEFRDGADAPLVIAGAWPYALSIPIAAFALLIAWHCHREGDAERATLSVLTMPFLATATSCLLGFRNDDWDLGYWLSMYVAALWLGELIVDGWKFALGWRGGG